MHELMAATLDKAIEDIRRIQKNARKNSDTMRPRWPMIVLSLPRVGQDLKQSMASESREPSELIKCHF